MGNTPPKIIFPWQCPNENQGKLRVRFKLQVGNPWTNLAEIWLTYCQLVFLKTVLFCFVRILNSFFVFELEYLGSIFPQVAPQVAQARNMSIGERRHSKYKDLYGKKTYRFCNLRK